MLLQRFPERRRAASRSSRSGCPRTRPEWLQTTTVVDAERHDVATRWWRPTSPTWCGRSTSGCLGFHVWPYRADDPEHADELRIDLDPSPGVTFAMVREAAPRGAGAARRARHRRLPEDHRQPRHPHLRAAASRSWTTPTRCAPAAVARGPRARAPPARPDHRGVVEGGARRRGSSSTSTRTRRTRRCSARGRCGPGPAPRCRRRSPGTSSTTIEPDELTIAHRARRGWRRTATRGRRWTTTPQSLEPLLELHERDLAAGLHGRAVAAGLPEDARTSRPASRPAGRASPPTDP